MDTFFAGQNQHALVDLVHLRRSPAAIDLSLGEGGRPTRAAIPFAFHFVDV